MICLKLGEILKFEQCKWYIFLILLRIKNERNPTNMKSPNLSQRWQRTLGRAMEKGRTTTVYMNVVQETKVLHLESTSGGGFRISEVALEFHCYKKGVRHLCPKEVSEVALEFHCSNFG